MKKSITLTVFDYESLVKAIDHHNEKFLDTKRLSDYVRQAIQEKIKREEG